MIDPNEVRAMRRLWSAVITTALADMGSRKIDGQSRASLDQARAWSWVGGRDFRMCCEFADVDPDALEGRLRPMFGNSERQPLRRSAASLRGSAA